MPKEDPAVEAALRAAQSGPPPGAVAMVPISMEFHPVQMGVGKTPEGQRVLSFLQPPFNLIIHLPEEGRVMLVRELSGGVVLP